MIHWEKSAGRRFYNLSGSVVQFSVLPGPVSVGEGERKGREREGREKEGEGKRREGEGKKRKKGRERAPEQPAAPVLPQPLALLMPSALWAPLPDDQLQSDPACPLRMASRWSTLFARFIHAPCVARQSFSLLSNIPPGGQTWPYQSVPAADGPLVLDQHCHRHASGVRLWGGHRSALGLR